MERIESSDVADKWKKIFKLIASNKIKKVSFGIPYFETDDLRLDGGPSKGTMLIHLFHKESLFSWWAALFTGVFYLAKGMWKKAIVIFAISFCILIILDEVLHVRYEFLYGANILLSFWVGMMAKYDYYRKVALEENFWW